MANERRPVRPGKPTLPPMPPGRPSVAASSQGVLERRPRGYGFLRNPKAHYAAHPSDAYVPAPLVQRFALREGLLVAGPTEAARQGSGPRLTAVEHIEGRAPDEFRRRDFDHLTPIDPNAHIVLESGTQPPTTRVMALLTPIG